MNPHEKLGATEQTGCRSPPTTLCVRRPGSPVTGRRSCGPPPGCPGRCFYLLFEERLLLEHLFLFSRAEAFQTALPLSPGAARTVLPPSVEEGFTAGWPDTLVSSVKQIIHRSSERRSFLSASFLNGGIPVLHP